MVVDPVQMLVDALASGAAAAAKDTVVKAVSDAYNALKSLLTGKYPGVSTAGVDNKPGSATQKSALHEILTDAGAGADADLLSAAKALLEAIDAHDPGVAQAVGVDLSRIHAGDIDIEGIKASGHSTGVKASDVTAQSMSIRDVEATGQDPNRP
jgi:hypothetical protein